jgi:hypothetical protein
MKSPLSANNQRRALLRPPEVHAHVPMSQTYNCTSNQADSATASGHIHNLSGRAENLHQLLEINFHMMVNPPAGKSQVPGGYSRESAFNP